jgi:hypothetical protein
MKLQLNADGTLIVVFDPRERQHQIDFLEGIEADDSVSEDEVQKVYDKILSLPHPYINLVQ